MKKFMEGPKQGRKDFDEFSIALSFEMGFGGGGGDEDPPAAPEPPPPPPPPPPRPAAPPPPVKTDQDASEERADVERKAARKSGRKATLLTGELQPAETDKKSLLG